MGRVFRTIGARLTLAFGAVLVLTCGGTLVALATLSSIRAGLDGIVHDDAARVALVHEMRSQVNVTARSVRNAILYPAPQDRIRQRDRMREAAQAYDGAASRLDQLGGSDESRALQARSRSLRDTVRPLMDKVLAAASDGQAQRAAEILRDEIRPPQDQWFATLQSLADLETRHSADTAGRLEADYRRAMVLVIGLTLAATLLAALCAWRVAAPITGGLRAAIEIADAVAAGDLTARQRAVGLDETGHLLQALGAMTDGLASIVGQVRRSSDSIATGSGEIATGNADLSQRTEQQASSLQQTAASMEQFAATVRRNAETANQVTLLANSASEVATRGGTAVSEVVSTMREISAASRRIADIIGVIDGIAFQTNILALNAAVEAARAGDQGRGFAVVAGEVRSLAQRSATAAREIKQLITDSVHKVETGSGQVAAAGRTMSDIVEQVGRVNALAAEISVATDEQARGVGQVTQAVSLLDRTTQQNAALVEQSAAAAENLRQQAADLAFAVQRFRIDRSSAAGPPTPAGDAPVRDRPARGDPAAAPTAAMPAPTVASTMPVKPASNAPADTSSRPSPTAKPATRSGADPQRARSSGAPSSVTQVSTPADNPARTRAPAAAPTPATVDSDDDWETF